MDLKRTIYIGLGSILLSVPSISNTNFETVNPKLASFLHIFNPCEQSIIIVSQTGRETLDGEDSYIQFTNAVLGSTVKIITAKLDASVTRQQMNYTASAGTFHKFVQTRILLLPPLPADDSDQESIAIIYMNYVVQFNPDYILVLQSPAEQSRQVFRHFTAVPATSIYLFLNEASGLHILCSVCNEDFLIPFNPETITNKQELVQQHRNLHLNMQRGQVGFDGLRGSDEDCLKMEIDYTGPKNHVHCVLLVLQPRFNFTVQYKDSNSRLRGDEKYIGSVIGDTYWDPEFSSDVQRSGWQLTWVPAGEKFIDYGIIQINDQTELNLSALWDPVVMDKWLWILCAFTAMALTTVLFLLLKRTQSKLDLLCSIFVLIATFLMEKSEVRRSIRAVLTWRSAMLIFMWAQAASLISYAYKGDLFAKFAATTAPPVPQNMEELARSELQLFSSAYYIHGEIDDRKYPLLNITFEELLTLGVENALHSAVGILKTKFVYLDDTAMNLIVRAGPVNAKTLTGSVFRFEWPAEYILVESWTDLLIFLLLIQLSGKGRSKVISMGPQIPFLTRRMPLLVERTFFSQFFQDGVYRLVESGITMQWEDRWTALIGSSHLKKLKILAGEVNDAEVLKLLRTQNVYAVLFRRVGAENSSRSQGSPLPLNSLFGIVYVFLTGSLLALLSCCGEIVFGWWKRAGKRFCK